MNIKNDYLGTLLNTRKGWLILYHQSDKVNEILIHPSLIITISSNQCEVNFKIVKSKNTTYAIITKYFL